MADVQLPSVATATPAAADTVVGVQGGAVKRFAVSGLSPLRAVAGTVSPSYRIGNEYATIDATVDGSLVFDGRTGYPNQLGVDDAAPVDGGRAADTGYVAGAANVAAILAGYDNVCNAEAAIVASQHSIVYSGADHSAIFGGSLHAIKSGSVYGVLFGGSNNVIEGRGNYSAIIGGNANKCEEGATDAESGFRSLIASCSSCTASGRNAVILGSLGCAVTSTYGTVLAGESVTLTNGTHMGAGGSTITMGASSASTYSFAWGYSHTVDGSRSAVFGEGHTIGAGHDYSSAFGYRTKTPCIGAHVFSARQRGGVAGNNIALDLTCSQETTNTVATRLSVAGSSNYPTQPDNSIVSGFVIVTGVNTATGASSSFQIDFVSERLGSGTPTLRQNATVTKYDGLSIVTVPTMNATTGGIYRVQVVGLDATNIAWDARIVAHQIVYTP